MKNGIFNLTNLIILIVVVAIVAASVIPTAVVLSNKNDELAAQLEAANGQITELDGELSGLEIPEAGLTDAEVKAIVDAAIAEIKLPEAGLSADEVNAIVTEAIAAIVIPEAGLTEAQVQAIVDATVGALVIPEAGLTEAQVQAIVDAAIAGIVIPEAGPSAEEIEAMIADAIAGIVIPEAGPSAEEIEAMIADAIAAIVIPEAGVSAEEVEQMIADAIAGIVIPEAGVSAEEVAAAIEAALADLEVGLSADEVAAAIEAALADLEVGLSAEEVEALIKEALEQFKAESSVENLIAAGKDVTLTEDYTVEGELVIPEDANVVINLNGNNLTVNSASSIAVYGDLTLTNGTIDCGANYNEEDPFTDMGIVVRDGGYLNVSDVTMNIAEGGTWCLNCEMGGTLVVEDSNFVADEAMADSDYTLLFNLGTTEVINSTFTDPNAKGVRWEAAIVNFADLTLVDCEIDTAGICVSTVSNDGYETSTTVVGGEFTTAFEQEYSVCAFFVEGGSTLTLDDNVVINVPNVYYKAVLNDDLRPGTVVGDGYTVNIY